MPALRSHENDPTARARYLDGATRWSGTKEGKGQRGRHFHPTRIVKAAGTTTPIQPKNGVITKGLCFSDNGLVFRKIELGLCPRPRDLSL